MIGPTARQEAPGAAEKVCGGCGLPGHRYGTTDALHDYNPMACINALRAELEKRRGR